RGVARRDVYLEKWVAEGLASAMSSDPEIREEVAPRVHPNGTLDGSEFVRHDTGQSLRLSEPERRLVLACDGATPAWQVGSLELLASLAEAGVLIWSVETVALDPHRADRLLEWVRSIRSGNARQRWLGPIEKLIATARA